MQDDQIPAPEAGDEVMAEEAQEEQQPEETTEGGGEQPEEKLSDEGDRKSKSQERRERRRKQEEALRAEKAEAERRAREAIEKYKEQQERLSSLQPPKLEDFNGNYEAYQAQLTAFQMAKLIDERDAEKMKQGALSERQRLEQMEQQRRQQIQQDFREAAEDARQKYPDFDAVAFGGHVEYTDEVALEIAASEFSADLAYFLGKNPEKARELSALGAIDRARAIGRLEAQVSAPQPKIVTTAPEPVSTVKGSASVTKSPGDMSPKEYRAWRESGGTF